MDVLYMNVKCLSIAVLRQLSPACRRDEGRCQPSLMMKTDDPEAVVWVPPINQTTLF